MASKYEFVIAAKDATSQAFATINKNLGSLATNAAYASTAVAGIGATMAALTLKTAANAKDLDAQAKMAGYTAEEFQALSFAFEQFNIDQEKFADLSKDVQDKLGDFAATGGGEFADFFENVGEKVGLTIDALRDLSSTDALIAVKNAMDEANVPAKEQVFYMESLANNATLLLPALEDNGAAIKSYAEEFRSLNAAMSQSELDKMKEVATDFSRVEAAVTAVGNRLALEFSPYMRAAADLIVEATTKSNAFAEEIESGFDAAENILVQTVAGVSLLAETMADAYNGYRSMPEWVQELGLVGAFVGGKKGLAVIAAVGKSMDGVKTTAEWWAAYSTGQISFSEWVTANNEEAKAKLDELKASMGGVGQAASNMPEISFGENDWVKKFKERVNEYKNESNTLSDDPPVIKTTVDSEEAEESAQRFLDMFGMLREINGETIKIDIPDFTSGDQDLDFDLPDFKPDDQDELDLGIPVSGRFDFSDTFAQSAKDYWADINKNGFLSLEPTIDFTEATAGNQALIDNMTETFAAIHEENLRFAGLNEEAERAAEDARYQRQLEEMEREMELLEKKGLLTEEIKAKYREAEIEAEENHLSRLEEIAKEFEENMTATYSSLLGVMGSYYDGMEGKRAAYARAAISLGQILLDEEKREALVSIGQSMYKAAMKSYEAMSGIPYIGPILGGIAAGGVLALGGMYMAKVSGLSSFEGGGYTGDGARTGGLDGKGGYLAMVHPQEYITDLTKSGAATTPATSTSTSTSKSTTMSIQMGNIVVQGSVTDESLDAIDNMNKRQLSKLKRRLNSVI